MRMASAGAPFELITRQMGARDVAMVAKVCGRFKPEKWPGVAAKPVATANAEKSHQQTPARATAHEGYNDSRGGTRTRDPGIMSAVL